MRNRENSGDIFLVGHAHVKPEVAVNFVPDYRCAKLSL